ncbi:MAG TPA: ester cyclase, partial [Ktedonobacterales bacterium]|nr:ester cyclase [Ktedonobacterales bacterium]
RPERSTAMSAEEHKAHDRRIVEEGLNGKNLAVLDEVAATDVVAHSPTGTTQGLDAYKQYIGAYFAAFPDLRFTIEAQLAEGDQSVIHWIARGTHQGPLAGIPATGKQPTTPGVTLTRWANGKAVEVWTYFDNLRLMQELGVMPAR